MERYTVKQRIQIVECYIQSAKSITVTTQKIQQRFGRNHHISKKTVSNIVKKFYSTGSVRDQPRSTRPRAAPSEENIRNDNKRVSSRMDTSDTHVVDLQCMANDQQIEHMNDVEEPSQQMKIVDLIQEILEQIFMYLDFPSIVRAADVCTQFRKAAKRPFKQIYAQNLVELSITPKSSELYHMRDGHVTITDLKLGMSTLRCFGKVITNLKLVNPNFKSYKSALNDYKQRRSLGLLKPCETAPDDTFKVYWELKIRRVLLYANDCCHESLIKFSIDPPIGFEYLQKPFSNVQHVCITDHSKSIAYKRGSLNPNFPQLRCLTFGTNYDDTLYPALEFLPTLREFTYVFFAESGLYLNNVLRMHPQLRKFSVTIPGKPHFRWFVHFRCVSHLQSIQEFELIYKDQNSRRNVHNAFYNEGNKIHLPNVRVFKLDLDTACKEKPLPPIQFEFDQLKSFSLEGDFLHDNSFFEFIKRHPTITNLCLKNKCIRHFLDKSQLMSALPMLEELEILPSDKEPLDITFIADYLRDFDSLNRCTFYCRDSKADVIRCCDISWSAQIIPHNHLLTLVKLTRTN